MNTPELHSSAGTDHFAERENGSPHWTIFWLIREAA
jgi:hypothetical protein